MKCPPPQRYEGLVEDSLQCLRRHKKFNTSEFGVHFKQWCGCTATPLRLRDPTTPGNPRLQRGYLRHARAASFFCSEYTWKALNCNRQQQHCVRWPYARHKALDTCGSWYAYVATFGSSFNNGRSHTIAMIQAFLLMCTLGVGGGGFAQRGHSAGTAPIIILFIPGTPLKTNPLQKRA